MIATLPPLLRTSAAAFAEHPIYSQDGEAVFLTEQVAELLEAAQQIDAAHKALRSARTALLNGTRTTAPLEAVETALMRIESVNELDEAE